MISKRSEKFILSANTIDVVSAVCVQTLSEAEADRKDIVRLRLSLEEILGVWLESLAGALVYVDCGKRFGRAFLKISVDGPDMGTWEDNEAFLLSSRMLSQEGPSFAQLGIPEEALALAVAVNAILDFFMTAAGVACLQIQAALASDSVGMLDEKKLKKNNS